MKARAVAAAAIVGFALFLGCSRGRDGPDGVRPAVLQWQIGVNEKDGPNGMVETVLPAVHQGKPIWRVVHRDPDPTEKGADSFDMYEVDRATLAPLRSVMRREGFLLALTFDGENVEIEREEEGRKSSESVRVRNPMPEGPGVRVLVAGLPLRVGYTTEFSVVDRWAVDEAHRVVTMKLSVPRRANVETPLGPRDALEVVIAANDGSSSSTHWVRTDPPRYPYRIDYRRGDLHLVSDVTRMVFADPLD